MTRHARAWLVRLVATALTVAGVGLATTTTTTSAQAAPGDVGYADFKYGPGLTGDFIDPDNSPTATKPQSKLWFAQGAWWGVLQVPNTTTTTIHSFDAGTQQWTDTGVVVDNRAVPTRADVLWDAANGKLFVASAGRDGSSSGIRVMRFRYDAAQTKYVADPGLPTGSINSAGVEAAVIAKDTTGRLWIAYTASTTAGQRAVRLLVSNTAQTTFGAPFTPAVEGTAVTADDIATVVAHDGKVSVVWSNQNADTAGNTAVYAAQHPDTAAPAEGWIASQKIFSGQNAADDHISLSGVEGSASGSVFMVIKEALDNEPTSDSDGLVRLLVLRPGGVWENYVHSTVGDDMTRPIILLEPGKNQLHVFATSPVEGGVIYRKTSPMDAISFAPGKGEPFIKLAAHNFVNNATSTKQNVTAASGVLVLASDQKTGHYVHNYVPGSATPLPPAAAFTATPTAGTAPLAVKFTDTSTGSPTSWSWTFGDGGTSTAQHPSYTYTKPGTYTVTLTAKNAGGSNVTTRTVTVNAAVGAPVANFTYTPTTGTAPLAVKFTDTSTGSPTSWSWSFGDGGTSTAQHPSYTFAKAGTYTVTLTAKNAAGSSTKTATVVVTAVPAPPPPAPPPPVPVVALDGPSATFTMVPYVDVAWHSTNGAGTVKGYDVEVRSIGARRGSTWQTAVLADQKGVGLRMPARPGSTYCLRVRGTNVAGVVGEWSAARCTALPIDDRSLSRSDEWRRASSDAYYMGTALRTRARGAVLTHRVTGKDVYLVVGRRPGGGKVKVYEGNRLVKRVSFKAGTVQTRQLVKIASHTTDTRARYRVVVVSRGRPVIIDGIAVTR